MAGAESERKEGTTLGLVVGGFLDLFRLETYWKPGSKSPKLRSSIALPFIGPVFGPPLSKQQRKALSNFNDQLPRGMGKFPADRFGLTGCRRIPQEICDQLNQIQE